MFPRNSHTLLNDLLSEFRILYLTGPRQAGKTSLAKLIAEQRGMQYLSLDDEGVMAAAKNDPHGFIRSFADQNVVLDEFQYAPELGREQLAQILLDGGYPEVQGISNRGEYHGKLEALIPYLAGISGNLLKYANVANDLAQNDKSVKSYIEILEWMSNVRRVYPFVKNSAKRHTIGMPKIHFVDTGLACYMLGIRTPRKLATSHVYGALLESFVYMECLKHLTWADEDVGIYHYRDKQQNEVDLVLERSGGALIGIEVKASASVNEGDFKGLSRLADFAGERLETGIVFYGGRYTPHRSTSRRFRPRRPTRSLSRCTCRSKATIVKRFGYFGTIN